MQHKGFSASALFKSISLELKAIFSLLDSIAAVFQFPPNPIHFTWCLALSAPQTGKFC